MGRNKGTSLKWNNIVPIEKVATKNADKDISSRLLKRVSDKSLSF